MCANLCHLIPMRSHKWPGSESSHPLTANLRLHFMTRCRLLSNLLIQPFSVSSIRHNQHRRCSQQLPHSSPALKSSRSTHLSSALLFPPVLCLMALARPAMYAHSPLKPRIHAHLWEACLWTGQCFIFLIRVQRGRFVSDSAIKLQRG